MAVFRSHKHFLVNMMDDTRGTGVTMLTVSTKQREVLKQIADKAGTKLHDAPTHTMEAAEILGQHLAKKCFEMDPPIKSAMFDRGGFPIEGRVKAFLEATKQAGLLQHGSFIS